MKKYIQHFSYVFSKINKTHWTWVTRGVEEPVDLYLAAAVAERAVSVVFFTIFLYIFQKCTNFLGNEVKIFPVFWKKSQVLEWNPQIFPKIWRFLRYFTKMYKILKSNKKNTASRPNISPFHWLWSLIFPCQSCFESTLLVPVVTAGGIVISPELQSFQFHEQFYT